jgi:heme-degrading monooxygenase HmoA
MLMMSVWFYYGTIYRCMTEPEGEEMSTVITTICCMLLVSLLAVSASCTIARPMRGPGLKAAGDPKRVVVAVTHAILLRAKRGSFDEHTDRIVEALGHEPSPPGLVAYSARKALFGDEVWTLSVWADRASLKRFVSSTVHRRAMQAGVSAVKKMRYHVFEIPASEMPIGWARALAALDAAPRSPADSKTAGYHDGIHKNAEVATEPWSSDSACCD